MNILSPLNKIQFETFSIGEPKTFMEKVTKAIVGGDKPAVSFPKMSDSDYETWATYCPNIQFLENAEFGVHEKALQIIEETKSLEMFHSYMVWYESSDQVDPILVGVRVKDNSEAKIQELKNCKNYKWQNDYYLLCRWGESLKPFNEIKKTAYQQATIKESLEIKQTIKQKQRELEDLEDTLRKKLNYYE